MELSLEQLPVSAKKLGLSLDGDAFVGDPQGLPLMQPPREHMLARWWVNDKSIEMRRDRKVIAEQRAEMVLPDSSKPMRIRFGLPDDLGTLTAGERVGLQVMYVDQVQWLGRMGAIQVLKALRPSRSAMPMVSDRLDFVLTADQISAACASATQLAKP